MYLIVRFISTMYFCADLLIINMFRFVKVGATALVTSLCISFFSSCVKDDFFGEELGMFSLALTADDIVVEATTKTDNTIDVSSFKVDITTVGGEPLKSWASYSEMPQVIKFGKGNYIIKSHSGDSTTSNFDAPSYSGSTKLSVYTGEQQNVSLVCKLNKMLVSVKLEENMKTYYSDLYTEVSVAPKAKLTFAKDETRSGYFPAGALSAKLYLTRKDGTKFEATMPQIPATKAGEHYTISFNSKNGIGTVNVSIKEASTNNIVIETEIPTEATTNLPPYFVASSGFTLETPIVSIIETATADVRMLIKARGYIKNCIIGVKSAYLISKGVPREFNLASTSYNAELAAILKNIGMVWSNDMNSSTIAEIDFSGMLKHLPADIDKSLEHTLTIKVEDTYQRTSDPLVLRLSISSPLIEIENIIRTAEVNGKAEVDMQCSVENGSFSNLDRVEILDGFTWTTLPKNQYTTEIDQSNKQKAIIKVNGLDISKGQYSFRLVHKNPNIGIERFSEQITAYLVTPKIIIDVLDTYDVDGNHRVRTQSSARLNVKIESTDPSFNFDPNKLQLKVRNQGVWENIGRIISSDVANKTAVMEITNLTPSEKYRIRCIYDGRYNSYNEGIFQTDGFHFESWAATQTFSNVDFGGRIGWIKKSSNFLGKITRSTGYDGYEKTSLTMNDISETYWATNGSKTIRDNFAPRNSWYMAPSVLKTNGYNSVNGVVLRSVAWDNKGPEVADGDMSKISEPSDPGWMNETVTKNTRDQVPATDITNAFKSSGKLFLGQYSCVHDSNGKDPNETYIEKGLKLRTKPVGINFYYKFSQCNSDSGVARAEVYDESNNLIGTGELIISSDTPQWSMGTVIITYNNQAKASYINIMFASSVADKLPSAPTATMQNNIKLISDNITTRNATGNMLSIDEVELKY